MITELLGLGVLAADQVLKQKIEKQDPDTFPRAMDGSKGKILLYCFHNDGLPFGKLKEYPRLVKLLPTAMTAGLCAEYLALKKKNKSPLMQSACALLICGSLSNLLDRFRLGYVVDYFSPQFGRMKKAIYNLGDFAIFIGSGLLLLASLFGKSKKETKR